MELLRAKSLVLTDRGSSRSQCGVLGESLSLRLCLVGFGNVGRAFSELLLSERDGLLAQERVNLTVTGICTARFGSITNAEGVNLRSALNRAAAGQHHGLPAAPVAFAARCPADVVIETTPLEPFTGAAATAIVRSALEAGRNVVSANKGPVAHSLRELRELAQSRGVQYRFESAVADGMPVFSFMEWTLPYAALTGLMGVLNSTSNLVLDALGHGLSLPHAVEQAQAMGVAEEDPNYDLDGWDAAVKLCALSAAAWGEPLVIEQVPRMTVGEVSPADAVRATARGHRLVSIAAIQRHPFGRPTAGRVDIAEIGPQHIFFPLTGTSLGIQFQTTLLQPVTVTCENPQPSDTAYGLLADIMHIVRVRYGNGATIDSSAMSRTHPPLGPSLASDAKTLQKRSTSSWVV